MGIAGPSVIFPAKACVEGEMARHFDVVLHKRRIFADAPVVRIGRSIRQQAIGGFYQPASGYSRGTVDSRAATAQQDVSHITSDDPAPLPVRLRPIPLDALGVRPCANRMLPMVPRNLVASQVALLKAVGRRKEITSSAPRSPLRPYPRDPQAS